MTVEIFGIIGDPYHVESVGPISFEGRRLIELKLIKKMAGDGGGYATTGDFHRLDVLPDETQADLAERTREAAEDLMRRVGQELP